jgi:N-formylglutamate amidohydrolase
MKFGSLLFAMTSNLHITINGEIPPFDLCLPVSQDSPFVFASPHSGRNYPLRLFELSYLEPKVLRRSEDAYVDWLFSCVPKLGATLIKANFPRVYIDLNRAPFELDQTMFNDDIPNYALTKTERVQDGYGCIPKIVTSGLDIYKDKLSYKTEHDRFKNIYSPYHDCLKAVLGKTHEKFGKAVLIDCHSMPSQGTNPLFRLNRLKLLKQSKNQSSPDIVLGDRFGTSCSSKITSALRTIFLNKGYSVLINDPYSGGYCTTHYGKPNRGYHAIQIEINRRLYLNEKAVKLKESKTTKLMYDLEDIIQEILQLELAPQEAQAAE